jgi:hypothetical protein
MAARGGTHLPTEIYDIPSPWGRAYDTYRNVERRHRNLPIPWERNATHGSSSKPRGSEVLEFYCCLGQTAAHHTNLK